MDHGLHGADDICHDPPGIRRDGGPGRGLDPRELEQVLDQALHPRPGLHDKGDELIRVLVELPGIAPFEELGEADDRPQRLLQVVARRVREPLQLLVRPLQFDGEPRPFGLDLLALGDIQVHPDYPDELAVGVADPAPEPGHPADLPRWCDDPELGGERQAEFDGTVPLALHQPEIVGVDQPSPRVVVANGVGMDPVGPEILGGVGDEPGLQDPVPDRDIRALLREPESLLAHAEPLEGVLALGDVVPDHEGAPDRLALPDGGRAGLDDDLVPGGGRDDERQIDEFSARQRPSRREFRRRQPRAAVVAVLKDAHHPVLREPGKRPPGEGLGGTVRRDDPAAGVVEDRRLPDGVEWDRGQGHGISRGWHAFRSGCPVKI